jgi:cytochrome bd ubiquinol oxidase subunit II
MDWSTLWFVLLTVVWVLFFVLEGFDFGVGALLPIVAKDEADRKVAVNAIGPHWDANEVFLIIAGAGTFAAFPAWYATLFSAFYLPLLVIVLFLILRAVAMEWRSKVESAGWRETWTRILVACSWLLPFLWGYAISAMLVGIPIGPDQEFTGTIPDLVSVYAALGGLAFLLLCLVHGANFLVLKAEGGVRERARAWALRLSRPAAAVLLIYVAATLVVGGGDWPRWIAPALAVVAAVLAFVFANAHREAYAFGASMAALALTVIGFFATLYPRVLVATDPANSLTVANSSSSDLTLTVMTIVVVVLLPVILIYMAWSYRVFRRRLGRADFGADEPTNPFEFAAGMMGPKEAAKAQEAGGGR